MLGSAVMVNALRGIRGGTSRLLLRSTAIVALDCFRINMAFRHFVIPLLVSGFPDFGLAALAADEGAVEVKVRQRVVGVDVRKFAMIGGNGGGMVFLLDGSKAENSFGFEDLLRGRTPAGLCGLVHGTRFDADQALEYSCCCKLQDGSSKSSSIL